MTDHKLRIDEALAYAKRNGKNILKKEIASELWEGSEATSAYINFNRLCSGKTQKVSISVINKICKITGVSPNFLFGYDEKQSNE